MHEQLTGVQYCLTPTFTDCFPTFLSTSSRVTLYSRNGTCPWAAVPSHSQTVCTQTWTDLTAIYGLLSPFSTTRNDKKAIRWTSCSLQIISLLRIHSLMYCILLTGTTTIPYSILSNQQPASICFPSSFPRATKTFPGYLKLLWIIPSRTGTLNGSSQRTTWPGVYPMEIPTKGPASVGLKS